MAELVHYETRGPVGLITVDNPPVNALSVGVPQGIIDGVRAGLDDDGVACMVLCGAGRGFIAGADIKEFGRPPGPGNATIFDHAEAAGRGARTRITSGIT